MAWPGERKRGRRRPKKMSWGDLGRVIGGKAADVHALIKRRQVIISYDEAKATFIEPPLTSHFNALQRELSYFVEGAQFTKQFVDGHWNGRRYLLTKKGNFYSGLIPKAKAWLESKNYEVILHRADVPSRESVVDYDRDAVPIEYARDYQIAAATAACDAKRGVIQMATGGGKTLVAALIINHVRQPTVFMVHTRDLLWQAHRMLGAALKQEIGVIGDGEFEPRAVTVVMIQTLASVFNFEVKSVDDEDQIDDEIDAEMMVGSRIDEMREVVESAGLLIMDEVHRVAAPTALSAMSSVKNATYRVGLSASPWRDDGGDLAIEAAFGPICYKVSASELIRRKFLVAPVIRFHEMDPMPPEDGENYQQYYSRIIVENEQRNKLIVELTKRSSEAGRPVLVLVRYIKHGNHLAKLFAKNKMICAFLKGEDNSDDRHHVLEMMRRGELKILIATSLADEGLDIPNLGTIVLAGSGKSSTKALQRVGRVLRIAPGKTTAEVHDFVDKGRWFTEHAKRRRQIYETEPEFMII